MKTEFFQIENRSGKIKLNESVHKESADKLIEEMDRLYGAKAVAAQMVVGEVVASEDDALESVEVEINTPGGSVFEGMRIYHALRGMSDRGVEIHTVVNGHAASMGSIIMMAGDKRTMTKGSQIMIHEPTTMAWGDSRTMKRYHDLLENIANDLADIYAERTKYDKKALREMMYVETWMDSDKAKKYGFVHDLTEELDKPEESARDSAMSIFAKLFPNAASEQIEAAQAEVDRIASDLTAMTEERDAHAEKIKSQSATIAEQGEKIESLSGEIAERDNQIEAHVAAINERDEKIEKLEKDVVEAKESASKQAIQTLASIGQSEPLEEPENTQEVTLESFWQTYNELKTSDPKEARKFFLAHADRLNITFQ